MIEYDEITIVVWFLVGLHMQIQECLTHDVWKHSLVLSECVNTMRIKPPKLLFYVCLSPLGMCGSIVGPLDAAD